MIVQVAGVHDLTEAEVIIGAGATHLGLPLRLPDGREDLSEAAARTLIHAVRERIHTVVITYQSDARAIHEFVQWLGADGVQLHGPIAPAEVAKLRVLAPRLFIIKSLVVTGDDARDLLRTAAAVGNDVDAFITDTFDPTTGRSGATGKTHDWSISQMLASLAPKPVILAGGLTSENVEAGIRAVKPAGVDVHTGVEDADGRKDERRLREFVSTSLRLLGDPSLRAVAPT